MKQSLLLLTAISFFAGNAALADRLEFLPSAPNALTRRVELIEGAQRSIDLATLLFDPCSASSRYLTSLLKRRAAEGVKVRVVMDGFDRNQARQQAFARDLRAGGIDVRIFNPTGSYGLKAMNRSHIKVLLADGARYVAGGRNVADEYFGLQKNLNLIDRDVYVEGASARQAASTFATLWKNSKTLPAPFWANERIPSLVGSCGKKEPEFSALAEALELRRRGAKPRQLVECADVAFVADDPTFADILANDPDQEYLNRDRLALKHASRAVLDMLSGVRGSLEMENWSYMPVYRIHERLLELRERRVPVTVVTNLGTDEFRAIGAATRHYALRDTEGSQRVLQLYSGGMHDRWELSPDRAKWVIHSKVYVADAVHTLISSFNLDSRSYQVNAESVVSIRNCPSFAAVVLAELRKLQRLHAKERRCARCQSEGDYTWLQRTLGKLGLVFF